MTMLTKKQQQERATWLNTCATIIETAQHSEQTSLGHLQFTRNWGKTPDEAIAGVAKAIRTFADELAGIAK